MRLLFSALLLCVGLFAGAQDQPAAPDQIGYKSAADADQKKTLFVERFQARLHASRAPLTPSIRPNFMSSMYITMSTMRRGIDDHMAPEKVLEVMDNTNVKTIVILTGMWGDKLQAVIDEMVKPHPGRFMVFTQTRLEQSRRPPVWRGDGGANPGLGEPRRSRPQTS